MNTEIKTSDCWVEVDTSLTFDSVPNNPIYKWIHPWGDEPAKIAGRVSQGATVKGLASFLSDIP